MSVDRLELLANVLYSRKQEQSYILLLGSGLSLTQGLLDVTDCKDWNDFYKQINESRAKQIIKLKEHFATLQLQKGYCCIAELVRKGYFQAVFTVNTDSLLLNALLPKPSNVDVVVSSDEMKENIAKYQYPQEIIVCLLHGNIDDNNCKLTFSEIVDLRPTLESLLVEPYLKKNLLLINFTGLGDCDLLHVIPTKGEDIWWISSEQNRMALEYLPPERCKKDKEIVGDFAQFNAFFRTLLEVIEKQEEQSKVPQAEKDKAAPIPPIEPVTQLRSYLPSSVLSLHKPEGMPLLKYELYNDTNDSITFVLGAVNQDYLQPWHDTIRVSRHDNKKCYYQPELRPEYLKRLREIGRVTLVSTVESRKTIPDYRDRGAIDEHKKSFTVEFQAYDVICWAVPDKEKGEGHYISLFHHIAAWVTPQAKEVRKIYNAARRHYEQNYPDLPLPTGYRGERHSLKARSQVQAIYEYIQENHPLSDWSTPTPVVPQDGGKWQKVRLPSDSLKEQSANCIERAVLYASLIKLADLEPVILITDRITDGIRELHALVGWKTWRETEDYDFLELMFPSTTPFWEAFENGIEQYQQVDQDWFEREAFGKNNFARLLDIKKLHNTEVRPMSVDED